MKPSKLRDFDLTVTHFSIPFTTVQAHIDPVHRDIVINGYGVKKKQAKARLNIGQIMIDTHA